MRKNLAPLLTITERRELLDQANAAVQLRKVVLRNSRNDETLVRSFAGASLTFPRAHTGFGSVEISWNLLKRVADGETSVILA